MCNKVFKSNKLAIASMLALVIGLILGTSLRYAQEKSWSKRQVMYVKYIAGLIIQMLKGLTAPIIVPSIIVAVGSLKPNYVGKIGGRALGYYIITTVIAVIVGINLVLLIKPGSGLTMTAKDAIETQYLKITKNISYCLFIYAKNLHSKVACLFQKRLRICLSVCLQTKTMR